MFKSVNDSLSLNIIVLITSIIVCTTSINLRIHWSNKDICFIYFHLATRGVSAVVTFWRETNNAQSMSFPLYNHYMASLYIRANVEVQLTVASQSCIRSDRTVTRFAVG